ncbi:MAG: hypothetical protein IPP87_10990 [Ideonella sp.]|nr:hypothetical protein [Ideonella sp.]
MNVYDLEPSGWAPSTSCCSGVFYHLKHRQRLALERIRICTGDLLFQTPCTRSPASRVRPGATPPKG